MIRFLSAEQDWYISIFNKKVRLASHINLERLCWTSEPLVLFLPNWVIIYVLSACLIKTAILLIMSAITGSSSRLFLSLHSWTDCSCKRKATTAKEYLFWTTLQLCKTVRHKITRDDLKDVTYDVYDIWPTPKIKNHKVKSLIEIGHLFLVLWFPAFIINLSNKK